MKIVCLGDSLTAGLNPKAESHWTNILRREARHTYMNKGICGDTTGGMLARFHRDVVEEGASSVILMGGSNDFIAGSDEGTVQANIMALVHQAFHHNIIPVFGIPIVFNISEIRDDWIIFTDFHKVEAKSRAYRVWLYQLAGLFHVAVLDFCQAFENYQRETGRSLLEDGMHPNAEGNRLMADLILKAGM